MQKNDAEAKRLVSASVSSSIAVSSTAVSSTSVSSTAVSNTSAGGDRTEASTPSNGNAGLLTSYQEDHQGENTISFEIDLDPLPSSLHRFCQHVGMNPAVVVKHLLLDAYQEILHTLAKENVPEEAKSRFRSVLENEFVMGRISFDVLEKAVHYDWLEDSDVEAIKRLREAFRVLLDEPSGT